MAEPKVYGGYEYTQDASGNWVRGSRVGPASSTPQAITIGTPNTSATSKAQADAVRAAAEARTATAEAPYAPTIAAADARKAEADATAAELAAQEAAAERASKPNAELARLRNELKQDSVLEAVNNARQFIGEGWSTGNLAGTQTFQSVPFAGQNSANLAATISGLQGSIINDTISELKALSATGASSYGSLTETEAQRLAAAVGALQQTQDAESLLKQLARVELHYRRGKAILNGEDPRVPEVAQKYGIATDAGSEGDGRQQNTGQLTSEGRFESDPGLAGANARVREIILSGGSESDVRDYLNRLRPGYGDEVQGIPQAIARIRQNPSDANAFNVDVEKAWVPNTGFQQTLGDIGMSGPGAALIGAADTASLGLLDNLTDNPDMARAVMSGVQQENPYWFLGGQVGGGIATGLGLERAAAGLGAQAGRAALAGETAFGAGYGAGSADEGDSRVAGALLGGAGGLVGGEIGRRAASTIGRGLAGVQGQAQRYLNEAGVRMTPGQMLGGGVKAFEDRLAGLPVVGDAIQARRAEGIADFNDAAFRQSAESLGVPVPAATAEAGIDALRAGRKKRYSDLLDNRQFNIDPQFENEIARLLAQSQNLPEGLAGNVATSLEGRIGNAVQDVGGVDAIPGRSYQQALRGLDKDVRSLMREGPVMGDVAEDVIRGGRQSLLDVVERQDPGVAAELAQINRGNMNMETLRDAVNTARNQGGVVRPAQLSSSAAKSARRFGNNQGTTAQPFYELSRAGQEVLPSQIPDSGTAGRLVLPALVGGAAGGGSYYTQEGEEMAPAGSTLATASIAALLASAPYSQASRASLQRMLMSERPEVVEAIGQRLIDDQEIARLLGSSAGAVAVAN